jgi:hypothetical protein
MQVRLLGQILRLSKQIVNIFPELACPSGTMAESVSSNIDRPE